MQGAEQTAASDSRERAGVNCHGRGFHAAERFRVESTTVSSTTPKGWEWSGFRAAVRLDPPPRPHLRCESFDRLLGLIATTDHLAVMRAYVRDTAGETAMIIA